MSLREKVIGITAILAICSAIWAWFRPAEVKEVPKWYDATVHRTKYVPITLPTTSTGECVVKGTGKILHDMPVTADTTLPDNGKGYEVKTTISPSTGETHIFVNPLPRPFFAFLNEKELGIRYRLAVPEVDVYGRYTFVRVGNVYGAIYASADSRSNANIMAEISYRW